MYKQCSTVLIVLLSPKAKEKKKKKKRKRWNYTYGSKHSHNACHSTYGEIIQYLSGSCHLFVIPVKNFYLFKTGAAWCIWGPKAKIGYLVSYIKLPISQHEPPRFFFFFCLKKFINTKKILQNFLHFLMWQIDSSA